MNNGCDQCRYCSVGSWDEPNAVYYCINENSNRFGTIVCSQIKGVSTKCSLYKEKAYEKVLAMPLNEALKTLLYENAETFFNTYANYGMECASRPRAVKLFTTNEDLLAWKDAYMRCLEAYKENGAFVQEKDEKMKFQYINGYDLGCTDAVVRPEKQRAYWITLGNGSMGCSVCGTEWKDVDSYCYCPHCGAKIEKPQGKEEMQNVE